MFAAGSAIVPAAFRRMARHSFSAAILSLVACAALPDKPPEPVVRTVQVQVPTPVPCFTEDERPAAPQPTPIDLETATPSQLAAALAADNAADALYMQAVEALFVKCQQAQGKEPK
jgi:hypothetical protein